MSAPTQPTAPTVLPGGKIEKPTLAGASIKTRKRNIAVPLDPNSFANAVVQVFDDSKEEGDVEKSLEGAGKVLDSAGLDFKRYGDTFFEVLFAGGRMGSGGTVAEGSQKSDFYIMAAEPTTEAITPYIKFILAQIRRKPFLIKSLEATLQKLMMQSELFDAATRKKVAIATSRIFALKVGVLPENVLVTLLTDRLVAKGTMLEFATDLFSDFLTSESVEELVTLLRKARLEGRLLDIFPPAKRSDKAFEDHFKDAGILPLVDYNRKKREERNLNTLRVTLAGMIGGDPPAPASECITYVKDVKKEQLLPDAEVVKAVWNALSESLKLSGKNNQQIALQVLKMVKAYAKLLQAVCGTGKLELQLINAAQIQCYEDSRMLRLFKDIVQVLYDADVLQEDTIKYWYSKGSHIKGRNVFLKDLEPLIKWLDEAEEDEDEE